MKVFTATTDSLWHGPIGGNNKGGILGLRLTAVIALNASTTGVPSESGTLTLATTPSLALNGTATSGNKTGQLALVTSPTMVLAGADTSLTAVLYGASTPGVSELTPNTRTNIVRCYSVGDLNTAQAAQPTAAICYSSTSQVQTIVNTPPTPNTYGPINRADLRGDNGVTLQNTAVVALAQWFTKVNDNPGCIASHYHEPNNTDINPDGTAITGAQINAETKVLVTKVKPMVNNGNALSSPPIPARTNPMLFGPIFAGQPFFSGTPTNAQLDAWVYAGTGTAADPGVDFIGQDFYADLARDSPTASAQAARYGVPWYVCEQGTSVVFDPTDAQNSAQMSLVVSTNAGLNPAPSGIMWFDANHNLLDTNLSVTANAGDTTITVDKIPGKSGTNTLLSGATIRIFGGTFEDVTTNGNATASGSSFIIPVPPLARQHLAGQVVWLMRNSVIKWRGFS